MYFMLQQWFCLSSKKKKKHESLQHLEVKTPDIAGRVVRLVNQAYQEYRATTQAKETSPS